MFKKMLVKKVALGLIVCGVSLFSVQSQAAVIASFDAKVDIEVSSTFVTTEFETELCCNDVYVEGSASGEASGSGDAGPVTLGAGEIGTLNALASGEVTGLGGYVDSVWSTFGSLFIDNSSGTSSITGDVFFDISWSASIFTDSLYSEALAGAWIYIENSYDNIIFDDYIEFDSLLDGPGAFGATQMFSVNVTDVTIAAGDYEEYYITIAAEGLANVPEPGGVLLAGLALLLAVRKRKMSA